MIIVTKQQRCWKKSMHDITGLSTSDRKEIWRLSFLTISWYRNYEEIKSPFLRDLHQSYVPSPRRQRWKWNIRKCHSPKCRKTCTFFEELLLCCETRTVCHGTLTRNCLSYCKKYMITFENKTYCHTKHLQWLELWVAGLFSFVDLHQSFVALGYKHLRNTSVTGVVREMLVFRGYPDPNIPAYKVCRDNLGNRLNMIWTLRAENVNRDFCHVMVNTTLH